MAAGDKGWLRAEGQLGGTLGEKGAWKGCRRVGVEPSLLRSMPPKRLSSKPRGGPPGGHLHWEVPAGGRAGGQRTQPWVDRTDTRTRRLGQGGRKRGRDGCREVAFLTHSQVAPKPQAIENHIWSRRL